ncbi:VOC family protein [Ramlibacter alkalitolerans]|uniref:VOC family protein n=1 Tax=Ramlibacter alkalitolerans TaxID=2039631 RepID=A0ABS1JWD1_9BURK|nr:VOC family protein [Ramlibacter alkalitolerans]MBL0428583.1 VOC family protein [Ramlibacter alkalitolerans]
MGLTLNHFSIRTLDLEATRDFYERVLQLTVGPRPPFPFPGLWMYRGDHGDYQNAVVHIIGMDPDDPVGLRKYLGDRDVSSLRGSGAVDHVAFFATGLAQMRAHLQSQGIEVRERTVPALGLHQLFLDDPNGVVVELNYPASEHPGSAA